jgi:3-methyladenine DNA glycosylase AlkD
VLSASPKEDRQTGTFDPTLVAAIKDGLVALADPGRAPRMQAYMKSDVAFLGVAVPAVRAVTKNAAKRHPPVSALHLGATAAALWRGAAYREHRYAATELISLRLADGELALLPLYQEMIITGAWWDHVDGVAPRLGQLLTAHPASLRPVLLSWSRAPDRWLRRASIIAQLGVKDRTDLDGLEELLGTVHVTRVDDKAERVQTLDVEEAQARKAGVNDVELPEAGVALDDLGEEPGCHPWLGPRGEAPGGEPADASLGLGHDVMVMAGDLDPVGGAGGFDGSTDRAEKLFRWQSLQLELEEGSREREDLGEEGYQLAGEPIVEPRFGAERAQVVERPVVDEPIAVSRALQVVVVHHDEPTIDGCVGVELDGVGSGVDRRGERSDGVLGADGRGASVPGHSRPPPRCAHHRHSMVAAIPRFGVPCGQLAAPPRRSPRSAATV